MLTSLIPSRIAVFPRYTRLRRSFRSPTTPTVQVAWSPARNSRVSGKAAAPFQTGVEPRQQDLFDLNLRRIKGDSLVEPSCLEICDGHPISIVNVSTVQTQKGIPVTVCRMHKTARGTQLRRISRVDLLSTKTFRRRLELHTFLQYPAHPLTDASGHLLAPGFTANVQPFGDDDRRFALGHDLIDRRVDLPLDLPVLAALVGALLLAAQVELSDAPGAVRAGRRAASSLSA